MSSLLANLAAAPFVNQRPVQRFKMAAWAVGALLAALNIFLWLQYRHDSTTMRARLAETRGAIEARSRNLVTMGHELDGLGLAAQNAQVLFLNRRIAERTFPWSLLFERIAETLPDGVRLLGLTPVFQDSDQVAERAKRAKGAKTPATAPPDEELVDLKIAGVAKRDEDLYELIDAFFGSPAFANPRLYRESSDGGEVKFTVDVQYRPRFELPATSTTIEDVEASHQPATANEAEAAAAESADEDGAAAPAPHRAGNEVSG